MWLDGHRDIQRGRAVGPLGEVYDGEFIQKELIKSAAEGDSRKTAEVLLEAHERDVYGRASVKDRGELDDAYKAADGEYRVPGLETAGEKDAAASHQPPGDQSNQHHCYHAPHGTDLSFA